MSKFHLRLRELRNSKGLSQQALADALKISKSSINMYERGEREPGIETLEAIADYFNIDMDYLIGSSSVPNRAMMKQSDIDSYVGGLNIRGIYPVALRKFPMLGEIACGEPIFADENRESYVMADMDIKADFCLRAKGNSMINARIHDGDIVFIKAQEIVDNGNIAAVVIEDEATLKRVYYYPKESKLILSPENPAYAPLVYVGEELNSIRILGRAVYFMSAI